MSTLAVTITVLTVFQVNGTHPLHCPPFVLSQDMKRCTACERTFSAKGYTLHVTGTSRSGCQVAFRSQVDQHEISDNTPRIHKPCTTEAAPCFDEDYSSGSESDQESESGVGENDVVIDETGSHVYQEDEGDDSEHEETIGLDSGRAQSPQHVPDGRKKEEFPGKQAGAPNPAKNQSAFSAYQQQINGINDYDPFVSKRDWEVAQWAKTCGVASAALTRLLQIDGVSMIFC